MPVPSNRQQERVPELLSRLCHRALDLESFQREAYRILHAALQDDGPPCWLLVDPRSLLPTNHTLGPLSPEAKRRELVYEYELADFNRIPDLLRGRISAGLKEASGGHPERSSTFRDVLDPEGMCDELRGLLIDAGACWGGIAFYRRRGQPGFERAHADLLRAASPYLAEGARRALVLGGRPATGQAQPGVILLDAHNRIESMNEPARTLLGQLLFVGSDAPELVHSLANRTRLAVADANAGVASVRAPTASGAWLTLHGSVLQGDADGRIVIVIQPTTDADLMALALDAYGLTERERQIAARVVRRLSTPQIGRELFLSHWTVKDHLKTIFEKVGVSSQAQLAAAIHLRWALEVGPQGHGAGRVAAPITYGPGESSS
jgi:DNA-binding CsgD family transcriptional regulator